MADLQQEQCLLLRGNREAECKVVEKLRREDKQEKGVKKDSKGKGDAAISLAWSGQRKENQEASQLLYLKRGNGEV